MAITNKEMQLLQRIIEIEVSKRVEQQLLLLESRLGNKLITGYDEIPRMQKTVTQRRRNSSLASLEEDVQLSHSARKIDQPPKKSILGSILAETQVTDEFMEDMNVDDEGNLIFEDISAEDQQAINRQPKSVQSTLNVIQNMDFTKKLEEIYERSSYVTPSAVEIRI